MIIYAYDAVYRIAYKTALEYKNMLTQLFNIGLNGST